MTRRKFTRVLHASIWALACTLAGCAGDSEKSSSDAESYNWYHDAHWTTVGTPTPLQHSLGSGPFDDAVEHAAGPDSRECATEGTMWDAALACIQRARAEHAEAHVAFHRIGFDSMLGWGIVSHADGSVILFRYDSSPCGGSGCPYALRTATCERVSDPPPAHEAPKYVCDDPRF